MNPLRSARRVLAWLVLGGASCAPVVQSAVEPGEMFLAEMNCVACHDASPEIKTRLASRLSPRLGANGVRATPQWLRAFLANPSSENPGTFMPDLLHPLPATEKAEAAEALTHYLLSLNAPDSGVQTGFSLAAVNTGKALFHSVGCVACHAPQEPSATSSEKSIPPALAPQSVPLGDVARKFSVQELAAFLRDPIKSRPSGRMPSLNLTDGEARAIAVYLLRTQAPSGATARIDGLVYDYYEQVFSSLPDFGKLKANTSGAAEVVSLKPATRKNGFALRFRGNITVPKDGNYTFFTHSDDGSRLWLDEKKVVDNEGVHDTEEASGKVMLKAGEHAFGVDYFDASGETVLKALWRGPGISKEEIPAAVFSHDGQPMKPLGDEPFIVDATKVAKGRELFSKMNCAACHQLDQPGRKAKPLAELTGTGGCLAPNRLPPSVPKFSFTDAQRKALQGQLQNRAALAQPLTPTDSVKKTMTSLNCVACHQRDGEGGPNRLRRDYFVSSNDADLGDEGVLPPHLNGAGAKLKPQWLERVLWQGATVRPYMATRMPQFGQANVQGLIAALAATDAGGRAATEMAVDAAAAKFGHKLVGTGGLSCISCHTFAGRASLGVPALDLTTVFERLQPGWFRRYLLDPQTLRPGTRMPPFWPGGVAANKSILGGDPEKQIASIWSYLAKGKQADLPLGLVQGTLELVADKEAIIYRHFIQGAGSRAIGVGYPEKANIAFDANEMRLALIWLGPFMDASKHRTGRGEGYVGPLGYNVQALPVGAPFAVLESQATPWPATAGRAAGYQFRGYTLDEAQRPAFRYTFNGVTVEDYPVAIPGELDPTLQRRFTLRADKPVANLYFRAAVGTQIEDRGAGVYLVDGKMRLTFRNGKPITRRVGDKTELLVPITFQGNAAGFVEELLW